MIRKRTLSLNASEAIILRKHCKDSQIVFPSKINFNLLYNCCSQNKKMKKFVKFNYTLQVVYCEQQVSGVAEFYKWRLYCSQNY